MAEKFIEKYLLSDLDGEIIDQDGLSDILMADGKKKFFAFAYERKNEPYFIYEKDTLDKFIEEYGYDPAISFQEGIIISITETIKNNLTKLKAYRLVIAKEGTHRVLDNYNLYLLVKK